MVIDFKLEASSSIVEKGGLFTYEIEPNLSLSMRELNPGLVLTSQLGVCPKQKREALFSFLMHANFLGQGTGKAAIGLDNDEKFLTLTSPIPYEINYRDFKEKLEEFVNFTVYWKEELERFKREAEQNPVG